MSQAATPHNEVLTDVATTTIEGGRWQRQGLPWAPEVAHALPPRAHFTGPRNPLQCRRHQPPTFARMGIRVSQRDDVFHVPYGMLNNDGTPESNFVDLKAHPEWIPVLPPCLGWPETRDLLSAINSAESSLMSLAADQAVVPPSPTGRQPALTSFVTLCYARLARNERESLTALAEFLERRTSGLLQLASDTLQRRLHLDIVLEVQPTIFHIKGVCAWSLTVLMAAYGSDDRAARSTWSVGMKALQEALVESDARRE